MMHDQGDPLIKVCAIRTQTPMLACLAVRSSTFNQHLNQYFHQYHSKSLQISMPRSLEIPQWKRHVIGAYTWQLGMPQHEVAQKLNVTWQSIYSMITRAKKQTNNSEDLHVLTKAIEVKPRPGRARIASTSGSDRSLLDGGVPKQA